MKTTAPTRCSPFTAVIVPILVAMLLLPGCAGGAARGPARVSFAETTLIETSRVGRFFVATATVPGRGELRLLIDTGAQTSVIDAAAAERLFPGETRRSRTRVIGANGVTVPVSGELTIDELRLGDVRVASMQAAVLDLSPIARLLRTPLHGLLGWDVLRSAVTTFDDRTGEVVISRSAPPELRSTPSGRFDDDGIPVTRIVLPGGRRVPVVVDTGSDGSISFARLDPLPLLDQPRSAGVSRAIGGVATVQAATLDGTVQLGGAEIRDPVVETTPGLPRVGVGVFRGGVLTIDGPGRRLWIQLPSSSRTLARPRPEHTFRASSRPSGRTLALGDLGGWNPARLRLRAGSARSPHPHW